MKLVKNYLYNMGYKILVLLLPILTIPYISRIFLPEQIGAYSYTNSIVYYFSLIGTLGVMMYGNTQIAKVSHEDKAVISKTFCSIYTVQLMASAFMIVCYSVFVFFENTYKMYYLIQVITLIGVVLDISWLFQGLEEFKITVLRSTIVKVVSVICIFAFIKKQSDIYLYIGLLVGANTISNLWLWKNALGVIDIVKVDKKMLFVHFIQSFRYLIPQVSSSIYLVLNRTLLGIFSSSYAVAMYYQGYRLVEILLSLVTALGVVMLPKMTNLFARQQRDQIMQFLKYSFLFYALIATPLVFGIVGVSDLFVGLFYGNQYQPVAFVLMIVSFIIFPIAGSNIIGMQVLIPTGEIRRFTASLILGACISLIANLIFIPKFGFIGASFVTLLTETSILLIQCYLVKDFLELKSLFIVTLKPILAGIIMLGSILLTKYLLSGLNDIVLLIVIMVISTIVYVFLIWKFKIFNKKMFYDLKKTISGGNYGK